MSFFRKFFGKRQQEPNNHDQSQIETGNFRFPIVDDHDSFSEKSTNQKTKITDSQTKKVDWENIFQPEYQNKENNPINRDVNLHTGIQFSKPVETRPAPTRQITKKNIKKTTEKKSPPRLERREKQKEIVQKKQFVPKEVPPPMHLLEKQKSEENTDIVFELEDISKKEYLHKDELPNNVFITTELTNPFDLIAKKRKSVKSVTESEENKNFYDVEIQIHTENNQKTKSHEHSHRVEQLSFEEEKQEQTALEEEVTETSSTSLVDDQAASVTAESNQNNRQFNHFVQQKEKQIQDQLHKRETNILPEKSYHNYQLPSLHFLQPKANKQDDTDWVRQQAEILDETLFQFNVNARVAEFSQGPTVTRFEIQPEPGVKVSKITGLSDDLKLNLAAKDIRIEAPIPGKRMVGIEIPNKQTRPVFLREILEETIFTEKTSPLTIAVGLNIAGQPITTDLGKMPHGLVAGSTGSGKSVFINSLLISLLYKSSPEDLRLLLIDPKMVELAAYNGIPHLVTPVITDPKAATAALKWIVEEMERRYECFAGIGVRDIMRYNEKTLTNKKIAKLPYMVVIIDELADLMMTSPVEVEEAICRIAQKARACGIHLIVATQRPSVDVITGLIKANIPTRIAFAVSAQIDSRTILDQGGAEKLLGKGDMLFLENGTPKAIRLQGTFVRDEEIEKVVHFIKQQAEPHYLLTSHDLTIKEQPIDGSMQDELFLEACEFAVEMKAISTSSLQRRFRIGYNRAARIIDLMEQYGVISEANGTKPRTILITPAELVSLKKLLDMTDF